MDLRGQDNIPDIGDLLLPLEEAIRHRFLTSLTGRSAFSEAERDVMALPVHLGGLGITNLTQQAVHHHNTSLKVTAPLVALILQQSNVYCMESKDTQRQAKLDACKTCQQRLTKDAAELVERVPNDMRRALQASSEKGASSWFSTLPIAEYGFALHQGSFSRCALLTLWVASRRPAHNLCMWQELLCGTCPELSLWWPPLEEAQRVARHHGPVPHRVLPWSWHRTSSTTSVR